jgi:hypothetical protein
MLVFVGAFFAAPLAQAMMLCTMPCCVAGGVTKIVPEPAQPCGAQECTVGAPEADVPAATLVAKSSPAAIINMDAAQAGGTLVTIAANGAPHPGCPPHGASAPIHVLNSTFRI